MNKFEKLNLSNKLMNEINKLGFEEPTQIQDETIPLILQGKDVIGQSATGSGKTLAFATGIIERIDPMQTVQAIILVPTRELAEQVKKDVKEISHNKKLKITAIYGGVAIGPQIKKLQTADVVVATPGRMLDHINRRTIDNSKIKIVILDEADRMVEMGFIEDVERIIKTCPKKRQTLLFSATMDAYTKKIAKKYMYNPEIIHAKRMVDPSKLKQQYYDVPGNLKKELLLHLLEQEGSNQVMVFCNTRRKTDDIVKYLKFKGIKATVIHGGLTQNKRLKTIDLFHQGKFNVLVCTDVAARGLHIKEITHVYNYDLPRQPVDYIHRIGRTARAGKKGLVINILSQRDHDNFGKIQFEHREFNIEKMERPYIKRDNDFKNKPNKSNRNNSRRNNRRTGNRRSNRRNKRNFRRLLNYFFYFN